MGGRRAFGSQQRSNRLTVTLNDDENKKLDELARFHQLDKMGVTRKLIEIEYERVKSLLGELTKKEPT